MFNSLSWLDFLYGIVIIIISYGVAALVLHITGFPPVAGNENRSNMMGLAKPELKANKNASTVNTNKLIIAPQEIQDQPEGLDCHVGPTVFDLLQEIKALTKSIEDNKGTEAESIPMYKNLIQKNSHLASSYYKEVINKFLYDQCTNVCGFQIDISEIRLWWLNK